MKVSLDGGLTFQEKDEVRIIYDNVIVEEGNAELHVTATHEGLISDVFFTGGNLGTEGETAQEITDRLCP